MRGAAQGEVWSSVHAKLQGMGIDSPIAASHDAYIANRRAIGGLEVALSAFAGQCGAVFGLGDSLCLDVLSRPDAFAALWSKLRTGYLLDALERLDGRATRRERIHCFLDEVAEAPA